MVQGEIAIMYISVSRRLYCTQRKNCRGHFGFLKICKQRKANREGRRLLIARQHFAGFGDYHDVPALPDRSPQAESRSKIDDLQTTGLKGLQAGSAEEYPE